MTTRTPHSNGFIALAVSTAAALAATSIALAGSTAVTASPQVAQGAAAAMVTDKPLGVRSITITYHTHTGSTRRAVVLVPRTYPRSGGRPLPLVISPHGRGLEGADNARLWGNLPALGGFAVVNPDGQGNHLARLSWGAPGQIDDLARMPRIVHAALPWLRIDMSRIYAVGGSMGGQETLLLAARHPSLLAGAVAVDPVADFAHQYTQYPRLRCLGECAQIYGNLGRALQRMAREETGGTPQTRPAAYAGLSPLTFAKVLAGLRVPVQIWWSTKDRIVVDSDSAQAGLLTRTIESIDPDNTVVAVRGAWIHTAPLKASRQLPSALAALGLLSCDYTHGTASLPVVAGERPACWTANAALDV